MWCYQAVSWECECAPRGAQRKRENKVNGRYSNFVAKVASTLRTATKSFLLIRPVRFHSIDPCLAQKHSRLSLTLIPRMLSTLKYHLRTPPTCACTTDKEVLTTLVHYDHAVTQQFISRTYLEWNCRVSSRDWLCKGESRCGMKSISFIDKHGVQHDKVFLVNVEAESTNKYNRMLIQVEGISNNLLMFFLSTQRPFHP